MTNVEILKEKDYVKEIRVSGHAFFAEYGQDIVCSAISMLCYTIGNQLLDLEEDNVSVTIDEGFFKILINKKTYDNQLLFNTLIIGFKMIDEEYENTIKIKEVNICLN